MATGLPAIGTVCGGPEDIITPESGFPSSDREMVDALAAKMKNIVRHLRVVRQRENPPVHRQPFRLSVGGAEVTASLFRSIRNVQAPKASESMKVTVIDCSVSGHRETYYKQFAQTWAGMGHETSLIAPTGKVYRRPLPFSLSQRFRCCRSCRKPLQKKLVVLAQCSDSAAKSVQAAPESSTAET